MREKLTCGNLLSPDMPYLVFQEMMSPCGHTLTLVTPCLFIDGRSSCFNPVIQRSCFIIVIQSQSTLCGLIFSPVGVTAQEVFFRSLKFFKLWISEFICTKSCRLEIPTLTYTLTYTSMERRCLQLWSLICRTLFVGCAEGLPCEQRQLPARRPSYVVL